MQRFNEVDHLLVIAGGSGAGWAFSLLELFCKQRSTTDTTDIGVEDGPSPRDEEKHPGSLERCRKLRIVLATRDMDSRTWFLETVAQLLAGYSLSLEPEDIDVEIHLTGAAERTVSVAGTKGSEGSSTSSSADNVEVEIKGDTVKGPTEELAGRPDLPLIV